MIGLTNLILSYLCWLTVLDTEKGSCLTPSALAIVGWTSFTVGLTSRSSMISISLPDDSYPRWGADTRDALLLAPCPLLVSLVGSVMGFGWFCAIQM